jgi:hypothetical protein
MHLRFGNRQANASAGIFLRGLFCVHVVLALASCGALSESELADVDGADYWDSGLVYHRHIDVAMLSSGFSSPGLILSGFVSAVAASANELYFIDEGAGQLVQVDLVSMTGRAIVDLQIPSVTGLYADMDGKVYAVDRAQNRLLVYDSYLSDIRFLPLGSFPGNPVDVSIGGQGQWLFVLDSLEGTIATLDVFGGVTRIMRPELPSSMSFIAPRAIAAIGESLMVLDGGADQVIEFNYYGSPVGVYAADDLSNPKALAADSCRRFFVADDHGIYLGFADMSLPGRRVSVPELSGSDIRDLWSDGVFLFVATRVDGIHMLLIDPTCDAP